MLCKCGAEFDRADFVIEIVDVGGDESLDIQAHCTECDLVPYTFVGTDTFVYD